MSPASEPSVTVMQVRPARADEQALIRHMVAKARLDPTNLHWQNFLLAEVDGQVVGCGQIRPYPGLRELGSMEKEEEKQEKKIQKRKNKK